MPLFDDEGVIMIEPSKGFDPAREEEGLERRVTPPAWHGSPENPIRPEELHTPDLRTRFYVGLWLPAAGAFLAYSLLRGNYWVAFVGVELLLVGWFTLAKLQ